MPMCPCTAACSLTIGPASASGSLAAARGPAHRTAKAHAAHPGEGSSASQRLPASGPTGKAQASPRRGFFLKTAAGTTARPSTPLLLLERVPDKRPARGGCPVGRQELCQAATCTGPMHVLSAMCT